MGRFSEEPSLSVHEFSYYSNYVIIKNPLKDKFSCILIYTFICDNKAIKKIFLDAA